MEGKHLFGGAMGCSLPTTFFDASEVRQVPDNQEVFTDSKTGVSIIIELLSLQTVGNEESANFFFQDLAQANGATSSQITERQSSLQPQQVPLIPFHSSPGCQYACTSYGMQDVSKYTNEQGSENKVFIALAVLRFPSPTATDILITISAPQMLAAGSSENRVIERLVPTDQVKELLHHILRTIVIHDWGLFVPE